MMLALLALSTVANFYLVVTYSSWKEEKHDSFSCNLQLAIACFTIAGTYFGFSPVESGEIGKSAIAFLFVGGLMLALFSAFQATARLAFSYSVRRQIELGESE
ncbi:MAG: hypothetical protein WD030_07365 [Pirellulales bacterium]